MRLTQDYLVSILCVTSMILMIILQINSKMQLKLILCKVIIYLLFLTEYHIYLNPHGYSVS